ncbi:MAG TPA: hypothetical protein VL120_02455 [Solirubrobacteraceae bacterium]|jgi:hypothetical protein|nr:hypothetical protein [Solirubrobacteraceae bacterium]
MAGAAQLDPAGRDRAVTAARIVAWASAIAAAGAAAGFSVAAAHAFKGHDGTATVVRAPRRPAAERVRVPPPQDVPAISGAPAPLLPPPAPPAAALPEPAPVETSGGS